MPAPSSDNGPQQATMFLRTSGRSLRIPMKPLSTSRPLIWCRKSAAMYGVIQTAGAKQLPSQAYFNFLGRYIPPSLQPVPLTPEEQEELRKREERKDRLHQNYLKRKASGAQKRYEDKIKAKKKAEMDATRTARRTFGGVPCMGIKNAFRTFCRNPD